MTIIQRPEYPLYSISLTAAIVHKYLCNYHHIEELLMDSLILERTNEITYFVKKCWNFNSSMAKPHVNIKLA